MDPAIRMFSLTRNEFVYRIFKSKIEVENYEKELQRKVV